MCTCVSKSTTERHFSRKNHNILQLWFWEKKDFMKRGRGWRGGALFVTILWILFSQIPFLLYEGYPYFFVWKGGRFLPNLKCPHYTVSFFVTTGGGAQWAKLMGQAMQLNIALNCEDYGLPSPINASSLWWSMSGEGRDWVRPFFVEGGGMCEPLKGKLCFYMFRLYVRAEMHWSFITVTALIFISLNTFLNFCLNFLDFFFEPSLPGLHIF